jgi:hypothetical protein
MSESTQALCFLAGANSIFTGDKLLTTGNAGAGADASLFAKLGLVPMTAAEPARVAPNDTGAAYRWSGFARRACRPSARAVPDYQEVAVADAIAYWTRLCVATMPDRRAFAAALAAEPGWVQFRKRQGGHPVLGLFWRSPRGELSYQDTPLPTETNQGCHTHSAPGQVSATTVRRRRS